ncbi:Na+/H+ antiporter NhaC [Paenibacillus sp. ACRRX]|uniref:Na+/H+ antiporter NhaC n=1 Tax=unclassified Paenibacillus TaxID=185978 RepID=UPI001EF4D066|nr:MULTISPECIES: Na+/H+ antiporter NhaC [unclassified Paenibacillus]MCG7406231.1 Na+/H+ antiporter NhaC [Paenibacillus sp. ACRRX]MDK8179264.1 Na+/H+ antiporter NhaC [Paenibacillus sp. UMB4589-SE434]
MDSQHTTIQKEQLKSVTFRQSSIIIIIVMSWILITILGLGAAPHMPLLIAAAATGIMLMIFGQSWDQVEQAIVKGLHSSVQPAMVLILIGILIAVWMMSGTVPTLLVYGTSFFQPEWFALSAMLLTVIVSMCVGSSLTTVGTFGVALVGIASSMGLNPALIAGAVVSGACFGDKMSPLSDTTNFASAIAGVKMTDHIRNMTKTTVPAFLMACAAFIVWGHSDSADMTQLVVMKQAIQDAFQIHIVTLLPLAIVMIAAIKRVPIVLTMLAGIAGGLFVTGFVQHNWSLGEWLQVMQAGYNGTFHNEAIAAIVNRGGVQSMMWSISLIAIAFAFGGLLQHGGVIQALFTRLIAPVKKKETLVVSSGISSIGVNLMTGEQYMSILLPGQMFKDEYERRGIPRLTLSRTLEDCGTLVNPLIPWGVSGAMMTSALGMSVLDYTPYAFFLWISPLCTFAFALLPGLKRSTLQEKQ